MRSLFVKQKKKEDNESFIFKNFFLKYLKNSVNILQKGRMKLTIKMYQNKNNFHTDAKILESLFIRESYRFNRPEAKIQNYNMELKLEDTNST
jgi:hypothetical protein